MEKIDLNHALIVEDDPATQQRLTRLLSAIAGDINSRIANSIADAKTLVSEHRISMALVDIGLPDGSGIDLIHWLQTHHPHLPAVVISAWGDEETVLAALSAGAIGYLLKDRDDQELDIALRSIERGGAPIDPFVARRIMAMLLPHPSTDAPTQTLPSAQAAHDPPLSTAPLLSERESQILQLVALGQSNREIAELIGLSRFTIEGYTRSIYRKLAVRSRTAAAHKGKLLGLLH